MGVGQLSESDAVDALRLPFYSSSHPTGSHGWRNQFDLGNTSLGYSLSVNKIMTEELNHMKTLRRFSKFSIAAVAVGLLTFGLIACREKQEAGTEDSALPAVFSKEVEHVLQTKTERVTSEVATDPRIIELVRESNDQNRDISLSQIKRLDANWMASDGIDEFIKGFITNETSQILQEFQEANDGYPEIFIADAKGLIVGLTNKTSDYYQADEDWWVQGYNEGRGQSFHGEIEYDE